MHDELVKSLRLCTSDKRGYGCAKECAYGKKHPLNWWCMDYLLKEAADAIEELQQIATHYEETSKDYFKDACYYRERVPHWIPATGLPSENGRYLTVAIEPLFGTTVVETMHWSGVWMYDGRQTEATVTHWMPLPEPPEELTGTDMRGGIRRDDAGNVIDWGITGPPGDVGKTEEGE